MSDQLPEGFVLQTPEAATPRNGAGEGTAPATSAASDGGALPPGFEVSTPESPSALPYMADRFKQGFSDFAGLPGLVVDVLKARPEGWNPEQSAMESIGLGGVREKVRGALGMKPGEGLPSLGATITKGWEQLLGVKKVAPPRDSFGGVSKSTEYLGKVAEFLGANVIPGGSAVAAAERKLATAIVSALGVTAAGTSAVEGKEFAERHGPSFGVSTERAGQIGELVGGVAGPGFIGLAAQALLKGGSMMQSAAKAHDISGFSKEAQHAAANGLLARELEQGLKHAPQSAANLARSLELSEKVPGWAPTLAQASNAPAIVAMQREVAKKSGEALAKAASADERNLRAIASFKEKSFPTAKVAPTASGRVAPDPLTDPARIKLSVNQSVIQMEVDRNARELRQLTDNYRRTADNEVIGNQLRTKYWEARQTAKGLTDAKLGQVYATASRLGIREDLTDVRDSINKIVTSDRQTFQDMPPLFAKVLQEYPAGTAMKIERVATTKAGAVRPTFRTVTTPATAGKSETSFEELHSLYKQANKDWADATAAGNPTKAHYMAMIRDQLQEKVNKYTGQQYGELATKFQDFNQSYAKYATTFREGAGGEIGKRTRAGLATDSEDIVSKVILKAGDKKKGVQDFFAVYGTDESAARLLDDGIMDNFAKVAIRNGSFDPKAAAGWLKKHETAMKELPGLRARLETEQALGNKLVNRQLMLQKQRQVLDRTVVAKIAKGTIQPDKLIEQAIADPKVMKGLLVGAITPESKMAVARAVADSVAGRPNSFEFLMANEKALKPVMERLGQGHWGNLKAIAEMEQIAGRVKAPTHVELSKLQDLGEQTIGTSVKGMFSRLRNMDKPMGVSKEYMVLDVGGRWFYKTRSEELGRLREAAMFDPDTARLLATLGRRAGAPTKSQLLDLQRLSFNAGAVSVSAGAESEREGKRKKEEGQGMRR